MSWSPSTPFRPTFYHRAKLGATNGAKNGIFSERFTSTTIKQVAFRVVLFYFILFYCVCARALTAKRHRCSFVLTTALTCRLNWQPIVQILHWIIVDAYWNHRTTRHTY